MKELVRINRYEAHGGQSLDNFLLDSCSFLHDIFNIVELLNQKRLKVNDEHISSLLNVHKGDVIELLTPQKYEPQVDEEIQLIYEDEDFFAVSKPAQLPIHPTGKYYFNTLSSLIERKLGLIGTFPYNRLDRETSGIVLFAKSAEFATLLQNTKIDKKYYALVHGVLSDSQTIEEPLLKKTVGELRHHMVVDRVGKSAKTTYVVVSSNERYSLLDITLHTGRKHQIRVHLAHIGHPLVGDKQYGEYPELLIAHVQKSRVVTNDELVEKLGATRQLLHCYSTTFKHPKTGKLISIESKIEEYFSNFLNKEHLKLV